ILDLFSRAVVGWSLDTTLTTKLPPHGPRNGSKTTQTRRWAPPSFRPGLPVHEHRIPPGTRLGGHLRQHEPKGQLLGQRRRRELLRHPQSRARLRPDLAHTKRPEGRCLRVHRGLLQSSSPSLVHRLQNPPPSSRASMPSTERPNPVSTKPGEL